MLTDERSDSDLVRQCQSGDRACFRHLYQRYQLRVRSTLYQLCGGISIDDLVQEVFLRVWKGLPKLRQPETFSTWLYRIAWNVAADERRNFAKQRASSSSLEKAASVVDNPMTSINLATNLVNLHYQDIVERGLAQLSFEHRTVLVLHDLEDISQKEVADIIGVPVGTVKSRLFHGRAAMRKFLEHQGVNL
ncbi:MAG: sigma-70 family RNA polymerase sigma factor [Oscillatoriales cyanobacterium RM2_1_1]|nr:sigma-70 family RNA polymerase sigma factor [Oscillatoriales cyanobacterium SM2_3_0]NJO45539.1 sigma-70 family RNA polymerase sigma factor [Oscillatoriales cyanobacterium RM2_1_1]